MFGISGHGYDMSTGIFSPDGRIFAAEYAKKAVELGETSIGILVNEGVVLLTEKRVLDLQEPDSVEKISKVDDHVGVATAGLMADARKLIYEARIKAQTYWLAYEEPVPAEAVAEHICDKKSELTRGGGVRPYGVAMIIGSVDHDKSPRLFVTDPVGTYWGFLAAVIGKGTARAGEYLEKHYKKDKSLSLSNAIKIALDALRETSERTLNVDNVEIAKIPVKTGKFQKLTRAEIDRFLNPKTSKKKE